MTRHGTLVALEGIDGAGTTSQLDAVACALRGRGHEVFITCEPSTHPPGQLARRMMGAQRGLGEAFDEATAALLFAADRLLHLRHDILPALGQHQVVLCDRYLWSSFAYQSSAQPPLPLDWLTAINGHAPAADLVLYFDVPLATARARRLRRGAPAERFESDDRQARVATAYAALYAASRAGATTGLGAEFAPAAAAGGKKVVRIDAQAPLEVVTRACVVALADHLENFGTGRK